MTNRILVVEDDPSIREGLETKLTLEGYEVVTAEDGKEARRLFRPGRFDVVLLDLMLPHVDGDTLLLEWRKQDRDVPILIVSAKGREEQKVAGLRAGADDYLAKPFGLAELMARIEVLLRRSNTKARMQFGDIEVDITTQTITRDGESIEFSRLEAAICCFLAKRSGAAQSREAIQDAVWEDPDASDPRQVDYHIARIRKKLESDPSSPKILRTRVGRGYEWINEA